MWLACDEAQTPILKKALEVADRIDGATDGMITDLLAGDASTSNLGRRLAEAEDYNLHGKVAELKKRYSSPEEIFASLGYDLNDDKAEFRKATPPRPAAKD